MGLLDEGRNPFSDDVGYQNILVTGAAGSGKTFTAATMPGKIAYLVVESQAVDNIKQAMIKHGRSRDEIEIFEVENKLDPKDPTRQKLLKNAKGKPMTAMQYVLDFCDAISFDPKGFTSVVLDSMTALQELEKFWAQSDKTRLTQSDWGEIIDDVNKLCIRFRDLKMHTMVIATTTVTQDSENRMHHRISLFGKKLPTDLPRYFNLAVTMRRSRDRETGEPQHTAMTMGDHRYVTKGHLALEEIEVPNVRVWFDKMSKFWTGHGQSAIPEKAEITERSPKVDPEEEKIRLRLENTKVKKLFDELGAPMTKLVNGVWDRNNSRVKAVLKYRSDSKLIEQLEARLEERKASK